MTLFTACPHGISIGGPCFQCPSDKATGYARPGNDVHALRARVAELEGALEQERRDRWIVAALHQLLTENGISGGSRELLDARERFKREQQDFRVQNDHEWKAKVDAAKARAEQAESENDGLHRLVDHYRAVAKAAEELHDWASKVLPSETDAHEDSEWAKFSAAVQAHGETRTKPTDTS